MISQLEKDIALRYLITRNKEGFLNIITIFSFLGISLGVAVLIIVMSVMNGFRAELIDKIIGFNPHVIVKSSKALININNEKELKLKAISNLFLKSNSSEGVIVNRNNTKGIMLRGYYKDQFKYLNFVKSKKFNGNKILNIKHISIGKELSLQLGLKLGDKVVIMSPSGIETIVGNLPKQEAYIVDSIFESGLAEFDMNVAFMNIEDLENLFNLEKSNRNLEIYLKNPINIGNGRIKLEKIFTQNIIYTWADLNRPLFSALKVERNVMFIILSLIIIVAAFNIISGLTILVKNKTREIGILKSIGVTNKSIKKIFFLIGFLIGTFATTCGVIIGILFSIYIEKIRLLISNLFNISLFPEEIYFLSKMPSQIDLKYILMISFASILITSAASIFPAIKASKLNPIDSIKYE